MTEKKTKHTVRTRRGIREYTYLGCPLTKSRTAWCFRLCEPDLDGKGQCGRVAPHSLKGRTQLAIAEHKRQLRETRIAELETAYLARPANDSRDPGVRITDGEAEVVFHLTAEESEVGTPAPSICFEAMHDAAELAVASLVQDGGVSTVEFTVKLPEDRRGDVLVARSLFVGMSDGHFQTESVLHDSEGRELGRGSGVFAAAG